MQIRCVAIDDEPLALGLIREYTQRYPVLKLVQTFDDAIAGAEFLRHTQTDLLFMDINMPDISGIDLVKSLKDKPMVIFTTAYKKFAIDGFDLEALDYLLKPIQFERFARAVDKAIEYYQYKKRPATESQESLFVRSEYRMVKVQLEDIEFIESLEDYIKIHFADKSFLLSLMTLKSILEKLPPERFKRIHRSYIVPVARVKSILNRKIQLTSSRELPISDSYIHFINEWMRK
ncbi:MAG: LytTR family DNA-binding domain-containing protein [Puia sp.]|nr:LytTR family DNA-binding domain-containing protein [Puia sp.]